jgi:ribosomal protein L37AE/L43A
MKKFQRKIENFVCEHCKKKVMGSGYTNHCPNCLYSKHVDKNPGDRAEKCGGLMEPINYEIKSGKITLEYKCTKCGAKKKNKMAMGDNQEPLLKISETLAKKAEF